MLFSTHFIFSDSCVFILQCQKAQNKCQIVHKEQKQASFQSYLVVSSVKSALILLPFLTVALHESGTRRTRYWSVTVYNKIIQSMQFDCSNQNITFQIHWTIGGGCLLQFFFAVGTLITGNFKWCPKMSVLEMIEIIIK
jgi:hypothetical protein